VLGARVQVLPAEMKIAKEAMLIIVCICSVNQFSVGYPPSSGTFVRHRTRACAPCT
jgi:hypothetical protein